MEALADDASEPVRIKPTATTEAIDAARTYAVSEESGETVRRVAKRRRHELESDSAETRAEYEARAAWPISSDST
jgi:hypothetical protein